MDEEKAGTRTTVVIETRDGSIIERPLRAVLLPPFLGFAVSDEEMDRALDHIRRITPQEWKHVNAMTPEQRIEESLRLSAAAIEARKTGKKPAWR